MKVVCQDLAATWITADCPDKPVPTAHKWATRVRKMTRIADRPLHILDLLLALSALVISH